MAGSIIPAAAGKARASGRLSPRRVTVEGVVVQFQFVNPQPFVTIDVPSALPALQRWRLDMDNRHELVVEHLSERFHVAIVTHELDITDTAVRRESGR